MDAFKRLLKTFVEKHRENRGNICRYSFDKDVIQIIATYDVLLRRLRNSGSNFFYIKSPEKQNLTPCFGGFSGKKSIECLNLRTGYNWPITDSNFCEEKS